jgi:hypothetical protein
MKVGGWQDRKVFSRQISEVGSRKSVLRGRSWQGRGDRAVSGGETMFRGQATRTVRARGQRDGRPEARRHHRARTRGVKAREARLGEEAGSFGGLVGHGWRLRRTRPHPGRFVRHDEK